MQTLAAALQGMRVSSRKPDLPPFDPKNIDIWLKRVDNAYWRSGVTDAKDKFAFIEPKFTVDADPRINEFLFGEGTAEEWTEFEAYLRSRYGRTKAQRASIILDGVQRDGKLPSEMFAMIKERIGTITVDDIVKEMVLRELPMDVRRTIHDKVKDLDGAATVKLADGYFDKDGKPVHKTPSPAINVVDESPDPTTASNDSEDVNAVSHRFQRRNQQPRFRGQNSTTRGWHAQTATRAPPQTTTRRWHARTATNSSLPSKPTLERRIHTGETTVKQSKLCRWHTLYANEAYTCEKGCDRFYTFNAGKAKAGRQA